jgi:signal transduction histidine kinase
MPQQSSVPLATAERSTVVELRRQVDHFSEDSITRHLLDAIPTHLAILNRQRQIVYANRSLLQLAGVEEECLIHGQRPGEVLGCAHATESEGGCGTAEACTTCGSVLAILTSLAGKRENRECCLVRRIDSRTEVLNLMVFATPFEFQQERYTVFAINDISHEKRRRTLEQLFFHDVLNMAGSVKGFSELLQQDYSDDKKAIYPRIHEAAGRIIEEIEAQRTLTAAESRELQVRPAKVSSRMLIEEVAENYRRHDVARGRSIDVDEAADNVIFTSDHTLLGRVLGNMIKNALEACKQDETVTIGCRLLPEKVEFWVRNAAAMPREAQVQVFRRSFSTKGRDRGLGTYSMKLLSEYLQGEVSFTSSEEEGTIFRACYPLEPV